MRPIQLDDAEELEALESLLFPENALNRLSLEREIQIGCGFVETNIIRIEGYLLARHVDGFIDILRLGVRPHSMGHGMGRRLLRQIQGPAMLCVRKVNHIALSLYHSEGFSITGEIEQSWVMRR